MDLNENVLGKSLIRTMATLFPRIWIRFSYTLNKISWELPVWEIFVSSCCVSQAVSIEILVKNDLLNFESAVLAKHDIF